MAITKVYAVRNHLNRIVNYAANEEKTSLDNIIDYATNPQKTEQRLFESTINCASVKTAHDEMMTTKRKFGKTDKVLAYHYILSFAPNEVTPELAHEIGREFAQECFGDRFEVVIGTHLDKNHLHNHIVVNSVSFTDGGKFRSTPESYYNIIRKTADRLCKEHNLSVIDNPKNNGKHYAEWKAQKEGKPTIRGQMREELDEVIKQSYTMKEFWKNLDKFGYAVNRKGENIKHTSIVPPFGKRPIRLDSLGESYTEEAIQQRIIAQRYGIKTSLRTAKKYRIKGSIKYYKRKKLKGFQALYFHYLYLFGKIRKHQAPKTVSFFMRDELIKFEKYKNQFRLLYDNKVETTEQLEDYQKGQENKIKALTEQRKELYGERRSADEQKQEEISEKISSINTILKSCRSNVRICKQIFENAERIREKQQQIRTLSEKEKVEKEVTKHEHKRRSR